MRWVYEYAFAFIVQARPCPTFGRPVHRRGGPHRLQPGTSPHALRIPPRDGHPALRELRNGGSRSALICIRLSPSCPFRLLHTYFLSPGPRGITPAFGYGAPHPSARGTSTLLSNALLSAHCDPLRLPGLAVILKTTLEARPPPFRDLPQLPRPPSLHAALNTPVDRAGACRFLPCSHGLPRLTGGSASTTSLSRPAQASLALRPTGSQPAQGGPGAAAPRFPEGRVSIARWNPKGMRRSTEP